MNTSLKTFALCLCLFAFPAGAALAAGESQALDPQLEPLRPYLGKTWKGEFKSPTPDKPIVDVARWERALNGKAVRILHSINDGTYGGETIVMWDEEKKAVTYHYFTTAGFRTSGTMTFKDGKTLTHEVVTGNANGVSEVRGTARNAFGWCVEHKDRIPQERRMDTGPRSHLSGRRQSNRHLQIVFWSATPLRLIGGYAKSNYPDEWVEFVHIQNSVGVFPFYQNSSQDFILCHLLPGHMPIKMLANLFCS